MFSIKVVFCSCSHDNHHSTTRCNETELGRVRIDEKWEWWAFLFLKIREDSSLMITELQINWEGKCNRNLFACQAIHITYRQTDMLRPWFVSWESLSSISVKSEKVTMYSSLGCRTTKKLSILIVFRYYSSGLHHDFVKFKSMCYRMERSIRRYCYCCVRASLLFVLVHWQDTLTH